jgi:hypothetical protein
MMQTKNCEGVTTVRTWILKGKAIEMSKWYEKLVQETYQALLDQESHIKNLVVQHDVKLTGKSGASHQIDVYWEFRIADTIYRTCIECRNYTSNIKKSRVVEFKGILDDIGNANGIIVTRVGFQEGALIYAEHHGVRLLLINPVLQRINMNVHMVIPQISNIGFSFDSSHAKSVLEAAGADTANILLELNALPKDIYLYDANGNKTRNLAAVLSQPIGKVGQIVVDLDNEYLETWYGLIKLNSISFELQEEIVENKITIGGGEDVAKTLIQDVLENASKYLFNDGAVGSESRRGKLLPQQDS